MRIISNFEDYYDGCTYMCGENTYYKRVLNLATLTDNAEKYSDKYYKLSPLINTLNTVFNKYRIRFSICIVGELIVPFIVKSTKGKLRKKTSKFESDSYDYIFEFIFEKQPNMDKYEKEHFTKSHIDLYNAIRKICTEPIISFSNYEDLYNDLPMHLQMHRGVNINPKLKQLGFSKHIPNHTIIQEIEMYLNKQTSIPNLEINEKSKLQTKGFDSQSFKRR